MKSRKNLQEIFVYNEVLINKNEMIKIYKILLITSILLSSCIQKTSEITQAEKMVNEGLEYSKSPTAKSIAERIKNEKEISKLNIKRIEESKSKIHIEAKNELIVLSDSLCETIEQIKVELINLHTSIEDERSFKKINQYMIEQGKGLKLKRSIAYTIDKMIEIVSKLKINITKETLPLKLYSFMEKEGKTWEEYNFKDMPYGAAKPILEKYKNDVVLSKLMILEEIAKYKY